MRTSGIGQPLSETSVSPAAIRKSRTTCEEDGAGGDGEVRAGVLGQQQFCPLAVALVGLLLQKERKQHTVSQSSTYRLLRTQYSGLPGRSSTASSTPSCSWPNFSVGARPAVVLHSQHTHTTTHL